MFDGHVVHDNFERVSFDRHFEDTAHIAKVMRCVLGAQVMVRRLFYLCLALCVPIVLRLRGLFLWLADAVVPSALPLYEMTTGVAQTQIVACFVALKLPDRLHLGPATFEQLRQMSDAHAEVFARFLRVCLPLGLLRRKRTGLYCATGITRALCSDASGSMAAFAGYMASVGNTDAWMGLYDVLKTGKNAFCQRHGTSVWTYFQTHPSEGAQFAAAMTALTHADGPAIAQAYPFNRHTLICDVGGGQGALLKAILAAYPRIKGVLVDQPHVLEADASAPQLRDASMAQRVRFVPGDFFKAIPAGCDAYILRHVLHDWDDDACEQILHLCRGAIGPRGRLLIVETRLEADDPTLLNTMKDLTMAVVCGGRERSKSDMVKLLARANLRLERIWPVAAAAVIWEAAGSSDAKAAGA